MNFVDAARHVVVTTGRWRGLNALYGRAYDLALRFTVNRLSTVPGVLAVMLRAPENSREWVPGLSDYDLTVLSETRDVPGSLRLLDDLWTRYRSIKSIVPQLGEMEVMTVEEYADFLDFGPMPTATLKHAHALFVKKGNRDAERVLQRSPRRPLPHEVLLDALSRSGRFAFPAWLAEASRGDRVTRRRAEHLFNNVAKRLSRLDVQVDLPAGCSSTDRTILMFRALTDACGRVDFSLRDDGIDVERSRAFPIELAGSLEAFCRSLARDSDVGDFTAVTWISYMSRDDAHLEIVVPDDLSTNRFRKLLDTLRASTRPPVGVALATESMWKYWLQLMPFGAIAIAANGTTLFGDPSLTPRPSAGSLRRGVEAEYVTSIPVKNNWRKTGGRPPAGAYATFVNHVNGYRSAIDGPLLTTPQTVAFASVEEGYAGASDALRSLGTALRG